MKPASLTRSGDFRRVRSEGTRARRNGIGVSALDRGDSAPPRIGYAVTSAAGSAVVRNRIKRRLRAAIAGIELRPGVDVVVAATNPVARLDFQMLVEKLVAALRSVGATA